MKTLLRCAVLATAFLCVPSFAESLPLATARIEFFSPQGTVKGLRQATARFSAQMVPFGDPRLLEPFDIRCPEKGQGRWVDSKNWVYDFDRDLPAGVVCSFAVKPGLKSLAGSDIVADTFRFSTGGPAVIRSIPREGNSWIDEEQIFVLTLDAEATEASILEHAWCEIGGIAEQVGVTLIKGEQRVRILEAAQERNGGLVLVKSRRGVRLAKLPGEKVAGDHRLVLQCARRFPNEAEVTLVWGKGIATPGGVATEVPQRLPFKARKEFVARFSCDRVNAQAKCIPLLPMYLTFNAPVSWKLASQIRLTGADGKIFRPSKQDSETSDFVHGILFRGPFPERGTLKVTLPQQFKDDAARDLVNKSSFPLTVQTDPYPPLAKFPARFGIIELNAGATLPVTLRAVEGKLAAKRLEISATEGSSAPAQAPVAGKEIPGKMRRLGRGDEALVVQWYKRLQNEPEYATRAGDEVHHTHEVPVLGNVDEAKSFTVAKSHGGKPFEVVGIPLRKPGFYVVELASPKLGAALIGKDRPYYVRTTALVTNMAAHFEYGRESSLVWVTSLDMGQPVPGAQVAVRDCKGRTIWEGQTDPDGIGRIREVLPETPQCDRQREYFVTARKGEDLTFVMSDWQRGIEPYRFSLPGGGFREQALAHTVFDRSLFRAGDTVSMKHYLRRHTQSGFALVNDASLPGWMVILHGGSRQRYTFPLKWDARGMGETTWTIPKEAKLGAYDVYFLKKEPPKREENPDQEASTDYFYPDGWHAGQFRVEQFRVPTMKALIQPPREALINATHAEVDLYLGYLSGGGAGNAPVTLRSQIQPRGAYFPDYENFSFAAGDVKEGIERRTSSSLAEEYYDEPGEAPDEGAQPADPQSGKARVPRAQALNLDKSGALRATIKNLPKAAAPQDLVTELEFRDANGEIQTVARRIPLWPSAVVIGIKPDSWVASKEAFKVHVLALDVTGKPAAEVPVQVDLLQRSTYSHRKRLIGGFYAFEHVTQVKRVGALCEGKTDAKGLLVCAAQSPVSGNVIVRAKANDAGGNPSVTHQEVWIAGKSEWWFDVSDNDRIDLLPEKKRYEPGETAKFQVRMPFRQATALVTVEREGVMETSVQRLSGTQPVIEVPVLKNYAPNVFVSALVVRGRLEKVKPTALIDLGRPAYKLGIAHIHVGWRAHELKVSVSPEKQVYQVREKAPVRIAVRQADGSALPQGSEAAVAAVDEGLLELSPNASWQLLEAMMKPRGLEVQTATAQMQVTGKRHFGRKAVVHGGDGKFSYGKGGTRELFDTLLLWKGRVMLDENGEATVDLPLNDSLTSFRIVAVASAGVGLFGSGHAAIRTTQDLQLLAGLPHLVREADRFRAGFTVRNASERAMSVTVSAALRKSAEGKPLAGVSEKDGVAPPAAQTVDLGAGEAREVGWEIRVPVNIDSLHWEVSAVEQGGPASDRMKAAQKVVPAVPVRVFQATLMQLDQRFDMAVERPADALPGRGGVNVALRSKLVGGLDGVAYYMSRYPYTCIEQRASRAIALRDRKLWSSVIDDLPAHMDSDGLVKYFPIMRWGSEVLTAYLLSISHEAGWEIPRHLRKYMQSALRRFIEGKLFRYHELPTADLSIRKMMALESLTRYGDVEVMLLDSITIEPNLWPTSAVLDYLNVLNRLDTIPERDTKLRQLEQVVRSRLNFQGTRMGFSTERSDALWWLMISADVNAARSILTLMEMEGWQQDLPRLVRGALGRQHRGHWNTTTANAWGVLAMEKFSNKFEAVPVAGVTGASVAGQSKSLAWAKTPAGGSLMMDWPKDKATLSTNHKGEGKPWVTYQSLAAIPLKEPFSSGYKIKKTLTPVLQREKNIFAKGDVVRVTLEVEAQADMTWVVVSDPIPAGATILGTGLGRDSQLLTQGEKRKGWAWPAFEERTFEAFRAYYEYLPKGNWTVEYTIRLNNEGTFELPATRAEAMYSPEMFGEIPNQRFVVMP